MIDPAALAALGSTVATIDKSTYIDPYLKLSPNMLLANFTTGTSNGFNAFTPIVRQHLIDVSDPRVATLLDNDVKFLLNDYKIARNLQNLSESVVEPILDSYGNDLMVFSSYLNPLQQTLIGDKTSKHFTGEAINIFMRSAQDNMFLEAENILDKIKGQFSHAFLMFNNSSWMHVLTNGPFGFIKDGLSNPIIRSFDLITGMAGNGLLPLRGMTKSPWEILEYAPYRKIKGWQHPQSMIEKLKGLGDGA